MRHGACPAARGCHIWGSPQGVPTQPHICDPTTDVPHIGRCLGPARCKFAPLSLSHDDSHSVQLARYLGKGRLDVVQIEAEERHLLGLQ